MKILIKNNEYHLKEIGRFGREGEIYSIEEYSTKKLAKVYDAERRTAYTQRKVSALINKFSHIELGGIENFIAYPEFPIYDVKNRNFCGFLMKNFDNHSDLFDNRYDLNQTAYKNDIIDDSKAIDIIATLFAFLQVIHNAGFILGDISPDNILLDSEAIMPALVDIDSVQLGAFYSNTNHQAYIDPTVRTDGYGRKKHFIYTIDSDIYALAIVCYEFIIGIHPYFFQTTVPTDTEFKKANELSLIAYLENNKSKIKEFQFEVFENAAYRATVNRLKEISENHKELYMFFRSLFLENNRYYFTTDTSRIYKLNSTKTSDISDFSFVDLIPQPKEDPEELELFMKQFRLKLY